MKRAICCCAIPAERALRWCSTSSLVQTRVSAHGIPNSCVKTFTDARRWQCCAPSSVLHGRHATRSVGHGSTCSASSSCLGEFVAHVQQLLQTEASQGEGEEKEEPPSSSFTVTQEAQVAALWDTSYHKCIFAPLQDAGPPTEGKEVDIKGWERYIPQDAETVPLFLVSVSAAANVLSKAPANRTSYHRHVEEMRALVLFVIYNHVPSVSALFDWSGKAADVPSLASNAVTTTAGGGATSTDVVPVDTVDKAYREAINELRVERRGREKVHELAPHLSADLLLRMTVLLDMVHSVVTTFALPLKGYAILYQALLCGLGTSAQLSNATLMVLLDCMQRCLDGFLADLELSAEEKNASLSADDDGGGDDNTHLLLDSYDVRVFLPLHYWNKTKKDGKGAAAAAADALSLVELEEQALRQRRRGGVQRATVMPTVVLEHLHIVARVLCQRMEAQILAYHRSRLEADEAPSSSTASQRWRDDAAQEARIRRQLKSEKGKLDLMRLEERKKIQHNTPKPGQRRTLRSIQAATSESQRKDTKEEREIPVARETLQQELQLEPAQLALCCTYLAAMRFHDDTYWTTVRRLSCLMLHSYRESAEGKTTARATEEAEEKEEEDALLVVMKDITFALDYVNRPNDYQRVMDTLVQKKYLQRPIPPPSQYRRAMSSVHGDRNV